MIARFNGHAVGLGATVALMCDIIIAAEGEDRRSACERGAGGGRRRGADLAATDWLARAKDICSPAI